VFAVSDSEPRRPVVRKPKRRFQFGVKTLLTLPVYVAGFCAVGVWFGWPLAVLSLTIPVVILCRRYDATLVETATLVVVLGMLSALVLPPVSTGHPSRRRSTCIDNLSVIGRTILRYEAETGQLPPPWTADESGQPLASWRTMILHYLARTEIYVHYRLAEPWNSPSNSELARLTLRIYQCPDDPQASPNRTSYLAVVGPGTVWSTEERVRLADIDDPSRTILLVEVAASGVCWAEPRDLTLEEALQGINPPGGGGISSRHRGGVNVLFADGHVEFLSDRTTPEELRGLLTFEKAPIVGRRGGSEGNSEKGR